MPIQKIPIHQFLQFGKTIPILDVRSPSEYAYAHIPTAHSFPIFDDAQRKEIGTAYKQVSREDAIKIGLKYFGPKLLSFIEQAELLSKKHSSDKKLLVHCWRGGMRSGAMAWLLSFYGFEVYLLEGGYKVYRKWVLQQLDLPFTFNVLGGFTGSGKTEVLHQLQKQHIPVIDLEQLANHKGSAFGNLGLDPQPSQEHFENILVEKLAPFYQVQDDGTVEQAQPIWIENESRRIGLLNLTEIFYTRMQQAKIYTLLIPFEERLAFIVKEYGCFEREKLVNAIMRIQKRLGGLDTKNAINHLLENNLSECFRILLTYYDKQYIQSMEKANRGATEIACHTVDDIQNSTLLLNALSTS